MGEDGWTPVVLRRTGGRAGDLARARLLPLGQVASCRDESSTRDEKVGTFANPIIGLKVCNIFVFLLSAYFVAVLQQGLKK